MYIFVFVCYEYISDIIKYPLTNCHVFELWINFVENANELLHDVPHLCHSFHDQQ